MKVLFVLFLAIASACAYLDIEPVDPYFVPEERITNGNPAAIADIPYQVGLSVNGAWSGGSLISNTWVLTAAHCVDSATPAQIVVHLGSATRARGTSRVPTSIILHPQWNPITVLNDVALLKIAAVSYSANIMNVALPPISNTYSSYDGVEVIASGWGKTSDTSGAASTLQSAVLTVISNTACASTFGSTIQPSNICVATPGGTSTCIGDSGGPIVTSSGKQQIGITSFGSSFGCTEGYPAAFARITSYRKWIQDNTGV